MTKHKRNHTQISEEATDRIAATKAAFADAVTELIRQQIADRAERMAAVHALTDAYLDSTGDAAPADQLERLSDYILREELTDQRRNKISANEYPFMSTWQLDVRRDREYSVDLAENHGVDGVNYNMPTRRHRTAKEARFIDKLALTKNRARKAQYKLDTSPGEVVTYNLHDTGGELAPEFTDRIGIGKRWADEMAPIYN